MTTTAAAPIELSEKEAAVLKVVRDFGGPIRVRDVSEALGMPANTAAPRLNRLCRLGLARRFVGKPVRYEPIRTTAPIQVSHWNRLRRSAPIPRPAPRSLGTLPGPTVPMSARERIIVMAGCRLRGLGEEITPGAIARRCGYSVVFVCEVWASLTARDLWTFGPMPTGTGPGPGAGRPVDLSRGQMTANELADKIAAEQARWGVTFDLRDDEAKPWAPRPRAIPAHVEKDHATERRQRIRAYLQEYREIRRRATP